MLKVVALFGLLQKSTFDAEKQTDLEQKVWKLHLCLVISSMRTVEFFEDFLFFRWTCTYIISILSHHHPVRLTG